MLLHLSNQAATYHMSLESSPKIKLFQRDLLIEQRCVLLSAVPSAVRVPRGGNWSLSARGLSLKTFRGKTDNCFMSLCTRASLHIPYMYMHMIYMYM